MSALLRLASARQLSRVSSCAAGMPGARAMPMHNAARIMVFLCVLFFISLLFYCSPNFIGLKFCRFLPSKATQ